MAFSGIIDRTSPITLARLLERIYDTDEPGELILLHSETKEKAVLVINRGEIVSSQCGDLTGDAAMKQLGSTFPWNYHFVGRNSAAKQDDGEQLPMPRPAKRPALKLKPLLASEEKSSAPAMVPTTDAPNAPASEDQPAARISIRKPVVLARKPLETSVQQAEPSELATESTEPNTQLERPLLRMLGEPLPGVALPDDFVPQPEFPPMAPVISKAQSRCSLAVTSIPAWLAGGDDHFMRFAESGGTWQGSIDPADWEYFRADHNWLAAMANAIGQSLGFSNALTMAVAEPQRAAGYGSLENGFVGILGGKGAGVVQVLQFDEPLPA